MSPTLPLLDTASLRLYQAMVVHEQLTLEGAAESIGDHEPGLIRTRTSIGRLMGLHLVGEADIEGIRHYYPVSPVAAEASVVESILRAANETVRQITQARSRLRMASQVYEEHRQPDSGTLTIHSGLADINGAIHQSAQECRSELLTFQPGGGRSRQTLSDSLPPTLAMLERGVPMRTIYQHTARSSVGTQDFVRVIREKGADVRTLDESFERLIIFDRTVAFIPGRLDRQTAIEIRQPGIIDFLAGVFERAWLRAKPFTAPDRSRTTTLISDQLSVAIIRHVVAGDTDAVTAQQLGISVRRCQEYIARIAAGLGSRSRAQLGFLVAQSGLLDEHPSETGTDC